jgi:hypothetical protein
MIQLAFPRFRHSESSNYRKGQSALQAGPEWLGWPAKTGEPAMFVKLTSVDRVVTAINATQVTFISPVSDGTRIRFGEGRSVTVIEPMEEVIDKLGRSGHEHG